jgi:hypothetical protein
MKTPPPVVASEGESRELFDEDQGVDPMLIHASDWTL